MQDRAIHLAGDVVHRRQRRRRGERFAVSSQDEILRPEAVNEALDKRALSDARLAPDENDLSITAPRARDRAVEQRELSLPLKEVHGPYSIPTDGSRVATALPGANVRCNGCDASAIWGWR